MVFKFFLIVLLSSLAFGNNAFKDARIEEQKKELKVLKNEFDDYYKSQEKELKEKLNEIEVKEMLIKKREENLRSLIDENQQLLKEIKMEIISKNIRMYNGMKDKSVAKIFTQMISEHNIQKVYDILIKLKSANAVKIMQKMSQKDASRLTKLMLQGNKPNLNE